jgi:hypothetical protein
MRGNLLVGSLRHEVDARPQPVLSALVGEIHVFFKSKRAHPTGPARNLHVAFAETRKVARG